MFVELECSFGLIYSIDWVRQRWDIFSDKLLYTSIARSMGPSGFWGNFGVNTAVIGKGIEVYNI